jgi:hypothetical protein
MFSPFYGIPGAGAPRNGERQTAPPVGPRTIGDTVCEILIALMLFVGLPAIVYWGTHHDQPVREHTVK